MLIFPMSVEIYICEQMVVVLLDDCVIPFIHIENEEKKWSYLSTIGYTESALNGMRVEISIDFFFSSNNLHATLSPSFR